MFYLTDFLVRHFGQFIIRNLGFDLYPVPLEDYFGNFKRVVWLTQIPSMELAGKAETAAAQLSLPLVVHWTWLGGIKRFVQTRN